MDLFRLARVACAPLLALAAWPSLAQDATRIVAATVFPDSARIERELKVPGGTRHIVLACIPAAVDVSTLQVDGDPELRLGEIRTTPLPATRGAECDPSPLETRTQALAVKRASLEAQRDSNELALSYLRAWGSSAHADEPDAAPSAANGRGKAVARLRPGAVAGDLRQAALDLLVDQARVRRELATLDQEDARLGDAVPPSRGKTGWRTVRFDVWTPAAATLHVHYNVANAWWRSTYRGSLDSARGTLRLDRQADIIQGSGEDWGDVHVTLSTGRASRRAEASVPRAWLLDVLEPAKPMMAMADAPSPAPMQDAQRVEVAGSGLKRIDNEPPPWGATAVTTEVATEFTVAQPVTLPSDGETHTLQLASQVVAATLKRRVAPRTDRAVYLLAEVPRPAGAWPAGPLQSWVDGALVGRTSWQPSRGEQLEIALGQDDQMRVDVESPGTFTQARGVFGGSTERTSTAVYAVVNRHPAAVTVELLDATPTSTNEAIRVTHAWAPQPTTTDWNRTPGIAEWTLAVAAQETRRVSISHTVTAPKDAVVSNLP